MVGTDGIEPSTPSLSVKCSAPELRARIYWEKASILYQKLSILQIIIIIFDYSVLFVLYSKLDKTLFESKNQAI